MKRLLIEISDEIFEEAFVAGPDDGGWLSLNDVDRVGGLDYLPIIEVDHHCCEATISGCAEAE